MITVAEPGRCPCPARCAICAQPTGERHDEDCPWTRGSGTHEQPAIAAQPVVAAEHTHRPGCPQAVRRPGPLFVPVDNVHVRCTMCGAVDTMLTDSFDSFGGTTEGYEKCTACGQSFGWADISAIR